MREAAKFVCEAGGWQVTNLKLQKLLYLAQMIHMGENDGARLFNGEFEAWDYGPVEPSLYHDVKMFGGRPIQDIFFGTKRIQSGTEFDVLKGVCNVLLPKSPAELVSITHWPKGAWAKRYVSGVRGIKIPDEDVLNEYRARVAK
jgi:uncharacterized phage-associated protein